VYQIIDLAFNFTMIHVAAAIMIKNKFDLNIGIIYFVTI